MTADTPNTFYSRELFIRNIQIMQTLPLFLSPPSLSLQHLPDHYNNDRIINWLIMSSYQKKTKCRSSPLCSRPGSGFFETRLLVLQSVDCLCYSLFPKGYIIATAYLTGAHRMRLPAPPTSPAPNLSLQTNKRFRHSLNSYDHEHQLNLKELSTTDFVKVKTCFH